MSNNLGVIKENIRTKFKLINEKKLNSISEFIKNNGQYQKIDNYFVFRVFNSVSQREEIFIGNVLFNDYISKLLLRTYEVKDKYYGQMELVYNDLENFYYVVKQDDFSLEELEADFKDFFADHLEELFFGDEDLMKGIYGDFKNLLLTRGYNYISLPFTILPKFLENKFRINMIKTGKNHYSIEDNLKLFTQYFNVSTMNYEHQSLQSFISKMLINNEIDDIKLFKEVVNFNYNNQFKFDLVIKVTKIENKLNTQDKKIVKKYLNDDIDFEEMKSKLEENDENLDNLISFIKRIKEENNFIRIVDLFIKITSDKKLISKLKVIKKKFDLVKIDTLTKKPQEEYNKYIRYYFEAERYSIELLNFLQRFIDSLKKTDKKNEILINISRLVDDCWKIVKGLDATKNLFSYFSIDINNIKKFFKEFFKQNSIYKLIFNDYLKIKVSISSTVREKFLDSLSDSKMAEKIDLLIDIKRRKYSKIISPKLVNTNNVIDNYSEHKCFICYKNNANIIARNVITGFGSFKFVNQESIVEDHKRICINCGMYLWLKLKYLGTYYSDNIFPEKRNIVFFYGKISEERVNQIQGVLNLLYYCTQNPSVYTYEMIDESIEELEKDNLEKQNFKADDLLIELIESDQKKEKEKPAKVPPTIWSWYKNGQENNKVNTHIFSVGQGENRLYTFVLPYALGKSDKIQKKYSQNRVAVYSMLSFLSRLTGVNGTFYYLSNPKLTDKFTEDNIFYYKNKPKEGSLKEYELLTEVAWQLVNPNNVSGRTYSDRLKNAFEKRLKLAKNLNNLPLITISKVYRELISKNNSNYKNLSSIKNKGMINLFPLIKISNNIRKFKNDKEGIKFMGKEIQTEKFEQFVYQFFGELLLIDGVFPPGFGAKPTEFEKYPRLFIKNILKTNLKEDEEKKDVLAGFKIWSNKMLHSRNNFYRGKEFITERMFEIKKLLVDDEYKDILSDKNNLIYFKRSLFGWLSEFLYPIYSLKKKIDLKKSNDRDKIRSTTEKKIENPTPEVEKIISYIETSENGDIILEYAKKYLINKFYSKKNGEDE